MAERVELRLQWRWGASPSLSGAWPLYRFARDNGWHCGHWHKTVNQAAQCVR